MKHVSPIVLVVCTVSFTFAACKSSGEDDSRAPPGQETAPGTSETNSASACLAPGVETKASDGKDCCSKSATADDGGHLRCDCLGKGSTPSEQDPKQCCGGTLDEEHRCGCSPTGVVARDGSECCSGQTRQDNLSRKVCSCVAPGNKPPSSDAKQCCAGTLDKSGYCACLGSGYETDIASRCCSGATRFDSLARSVCQ